MKLSLVRFLWVRLSLAAIFGFGAVSSASALVLFDSGPQTISFPDSTTLGRISRDGVPSDWSASKAFPGILNATTSYNYDTFVIHVTDTPYIQISVDEPNSASTFTAAYLDSFNPSSLATNYLGDLGASGNSFGNPGFFQVIVPAGHDLVLFVESTTLAAGPYGYSLLVEGFIDNQFTDPTAAVPEPSTWAMMILGFAAVGFMAYRRRSSAPSVA
jgi:hypothetical protein